MLSLVLIFKNYLRLLGMEHLIVRTHGPKLEVGSRKIKYAGTSLYR